MTDWPGTKHLDKQRQTGIMRLLNKSFTIGCCWVSCLERRFIISTSSFYSIVDCNCIITHRASSIAGFQTGTGKFPNAK